MAKARIYHNPRCTKSRQTLALLNDRNVDVEIVEYLKAPPSISQLDSLCKALGVEPLEMMRTKEARFRELGLAKGDRRPRREWLRIMHDNPILIERPIVIHGKKAALGRPPENVLEIL
ncbi:MAG: arsenate reductase (glutaredoxin) [Candidatus Latescibacterota bacterium]|nr:MAG: arsenate reductase (glutaredoxin) [Candidatus Latescibacterota bacterium]